MHLGSHGFYVQDHAGESTPAAMANLLLIARLRDRLKREAEADSKAAMARKVEELPIAVRLAMQRWASVYCP